MTSIFLLVAAVTIPLRNPFWPVDYAGERETITAEPRVVAKVQPETSRTDDAATSLSAEALAEAAAEAAQGSAENRRWIAARKSLVIGGHFRLSGDSPRQAISINGKIYADGDFVSVTHDGYRFTWRVKGLSDNSTLVLERIKWKEVSP